MFANFICIQAIHHFITYNSMVCISGRSDSGEENVVLDYTKGERLWAFKNEPISYFVDH